MDEGRQELELSHLQISCLPYHAVIFLFLHHNSLEVQQYRKCPPERTSATPLPIASGSHHGVLILMCEKRSRMA